MRLLLALAILTGSAYGMDVWPDLLKEVEKQSKKDEKRFNEVRVQIQGAIQQGDKESSVINQFMYQNRGILLADPAKLQLASVREVCHVFRLMFIVLENKTPDPTKYRDELKRWHDHLVRLNGL